MGMLDWASAALDITGEVLQNEIESLYWECFGAMYMYLNDSAASNAGAAAILDNYVLPAVESVIDSWGSGWPLSAQGGAGAAGAMSHGAASETWGDSCDELDGELDGIIEQATELYLILVAIGEEDDEDVEMDDDDSDFDS